MHEKYDACVSVCDDVCEQMNVSGTGREINKEEERKKIYYTDSVNSTEKAYKQKPTV